MPFYKSLGAFYYFKHYQVDEGLQHNNVTCITQDKLGFIWIGSRGGLNRFDGYKFKSYTTDKSKTGASYIRALRIDHNGLVWIGTSSGIFLLDPVTEKITPVKAFEDMNVRDILTDVHNNLWASVSDQLYFYEPTTKKLTNYNTTAVAIDIDPTGNLWIATLDNKIKKIHPGTGITTNINIADFEKFENRSITKVKIRNQSILIGSRHGCFNLDLIKNQKRDILVGNEKGNNIFVRDIFYTGSKNTCYIATEVGLFIYNTATNEITHLTKKSGDPYSLNDNAVYSVFEDNREGLWVGTFFGGLNYVSKEKNQFEKYYAINIPGAISGNAVREICGDDKGNIWIGTEDAGVNKFDKLTGKFSVLSHIGSSNGPSYPNIHGLLIYDKKLFVGPFFRGLEVIDIETGRIIDRQFPLPPNQNNRGDIVMSIFKTSENRILVGTTGSGLYDYNQYTRKLIPILQIPGDTHIYDIAEDHTGTIWAGTISKGVFYFNLKTGQSGNVNFNKINDNNRNTFVVQGIYEDRQYNIWLATDGGGLFKINQNKEIEKRYTTHEGLPSNNLYRILEDSRGNLWISTLKGLVCFNIATEKVTTFTKSNGLTTDQFNFNSAYKDADGKMYFGTVKGLIAFEPEKLTQNKIAPPLFITGFFINYDTPTSDLDTKPSQAILSTDSITLSYLQTTFSIEFAALDYSSANAVQYKYKMEGLNDNWTYLASNRKAYFTDLPPGEYKFVVQAESNLRYWTTVPKTIVIKIMPPFWKSTAAFVFYNIAGILLISSLLYLHHTNLQKKNKHKLQLFELAKEKEVYQAKINFFTNVAHEIQTPIALIKGPTEWALTNINNLSTVEKNLELIQKNTDRLISLTTQLLDFRKMETNRFTLNFALTNVSELTRNTLSYFMAEIEKRNLQLKVDLPEKDIEAFIDEEAFIKIFSNLISNAVKYLIKIIEIKLYIPEGCISEFRLRISNDGTQIPEENQKKIFEPFYRLKNNAHLPGAGIGLSLAKSLAQLHGGDLEYISEASYFNIFELNLPMNPEGISKK